jgi:hypothetical protein
VISVVYERKLLNSYKKLIQMKNKRIQGFTGKHEGRKLLERPKRRWEDNIKIDLREVGWRAWSGSILLKTETNAVSCKCGDKPTGFIKRGEFLD